MIHKNVELYNVAELAPSDKGEGWHMLRVPADLRATLNEAAKNCTIYPAGCEIRFNLAEGGKAEIILAAEGGDVTPLTVEIYQGCFRTKMAVLREEPTRITISHSPSQAKLEQIAERHKLPFDSRLTRVLLPATIPMRLVGIEGELTPPRREQSPARKYLAYGSSITHGANACRPSGAYSMLTARHLQADLISQGYGGGAHMEETMARYLAGRDDWDFATLEMGINVGGWSLDRFAAAVRRFIDIIASAHRDKWIFCIDLFTFYADLTEEPTEAWRGFRDAVRQAVSAAGMPRLVHVDGRDILRGPAGLSHDLVHPTDDGFAEMAANLSALMRRTMEGS
jgi:hypothetical protein